MDTIHHEVWINARRETVFDAITCHEGLDAWWGKVVNAEPQVGAIVDFDHGHGDLLRMRITDLEPNQRLGWKCISDFSHPGNPASEWLGTRLLFELEEGKPTGFEHLDSMFPDGEFTVLHFRHTGWTEDSRWFGFCNFAWGVTLAGLAEYCQSSDS